MAKPLPLLTPAIVSDEAQLALAIDRVLALDRRLQRFRRQVIELQDRLRSLVSEEAWAAYLKVEEAQSAAWAEASAVLVTWAFTEGHRSAGRRP